MYAYLRLKSGELLAMEPRIRQIGGWLLLCSGLISLWIGGDRVLSELGGTAQIAYGALMLGASWWALSLRKT